MGVWGVDQNTYMGCDGGLNYSNQFKWFALDDVAQPQEVVSIQKPAWTGLTEEGIYVNVGVEFDGIKYNGGDVTLADYCRKEGNGGILYISKFTDKCTTVEFTKDGTVVRGLRIQNDKGTGDACEVSGGGASTSDEPSEGAPVPDKETAKVFAIYSDAYTVNPGWGYLESWGQSTTLENKEVSSNNYLLYSSFNYLGWEVSGEAGAHIDVSDYQYLHIDIWANEDGSVNIYPIQGVKGTAAVNDSKSKTLSLIGQQWNSFDIALSDAAFSGLNFSSIYQFKFANGVTCTKFAVDNVYFYKDEDLTPAAPISSCFGTAGHFANPSVKKIAYQFSYNEGKVTITLKSLTGYDLNFAEVHIVGVGNYAMESDGNGGYTKTLDAAENTQWYLRFLYSDTNMGADRDLTAQNLESNDSHIIYYLVGGCVPVDIIKDMNFALASNGASATASSSAYPAAEAIDGNMGTRWASDTSDPQWLLVNLGQRRVFNTVKLVHEGAWIKSFDIQISDDGENFVTIKSIDNQDLKAGPFPYSQELSLGADYTAQYVRMYGRARGTGYGYSLWEFEVYYPGVQTLTTYTASIASPILTIGSNTPITIVAKDQNNNNMDVETTYTVNPAIGTVTDGVYTAIATGMATITCTSGEKETTITVYNEVSANLALNKTSVAGHEADAAYAASLANNSNTGDRWGSNGGTHPDDDWWYVDLEATYDIAEVLIKWEHARPAKYVLEVSADASVWNTIGTYDVLPSDTEYERYTGLTPVPGRYLRVRATSTEGGYDNLNWGISIYDIQVFGTENVSANKAVAATVNNAAMGSASVKQNEVEVSEVENGTEVTFTAVANEGYDFVNWTLGGVEVSTNASYTCQITATTALVANFEPHRTAYCQYPLTVEIGGVNRTVYLSITNIRENTYKILFEGSENCKIINAHDNIQFRLQNINGSSDVHHFAQAEWTVDATGDGAAYITFTATDFRNIIVNNRYCPLITSASAATEFNFPDNAYIDWSATCTDEEAPVMDAPTATAIGMSTVRLSMQATDNMAGRLTYAIAYYPTAGGDTQNAEVSGTAGAMTTYMVNGLTPNTEYTFSITASDGTNTSAAQTCTATPSLPVPPTPDKNSDYVLSLYSDTYPSVLAHDFIKNNWAWPTYEELVVGEQHVLHYYNDGTAENLPDIAWGDNNNDYGKALIAQTGYNADNDNKGLDVRKMEYIHFDMWSRIATNYPEVYLNDTHAGSFQLKGEGWQSFDINITGLSDGDKQNIRWIKFVGLRTPNPVEVIVANVFFYSTSAAYTLDEQTDNTATINSIDQKITSVQLTRSFNANELYTLVLPFDVDAAQTADKLPGTLTQLNNTYVKDNGDLRLNFVNVNSIEAGVPYLYEPSADVIDPVFGHVTIDKDPHPIVPADGLAAFYGIYDPTTVAALQSSTTNSYVLGNDLYLYEVATIPDNSVPMNAFRGYFVLNFPASAGIGSRARIVFNSTEVETTTALDEIGSAAQPVKRIVNGQLIIEHNGHEYNAQGLKVK